jgi:hypothetical protein
VDFRVRFRSLPPPGRVLEVGCGHGRHRTRAQRRGL